MNELPEQTLFESTALRRNFNHLAFGLGIALGIFFLYQLMGGGLAGIMLFTGYKEWLWLAQGIGQVVFMLFPAILVMKYSPLGHRGLLRYEGQTSKIQWIAGIIGILAFQLFADSFTTLQEQLIPQSIMPLYENMKQQMESMYATLLGGGGGVNIIKGLVIGAIIPALSEEVLFRGIMQRSLEQVWSPLRAILWTSVIFGVIHLNPADIVSLVFIGGYLGVLAYSTKSLALPITVHFLNNAIAVVALNLTDTNSINQPDGAPIWIAGVLCTSGLAAACVAAMVVWRGRVENEISN